jgi:hypothetical protein
MPTYTAYFRTDDQYATHDFEADTPEQALALARQLHNDNQLDLMFEPYDGGMPVDEIAIQDANFNELAVWRDADLHLRLAANDLLEALEQAIQALNTVPRFRVPHLDTDRYRIASTCDHAIAKAKGGAQ